MAESPKGTASAPRVRAAIVGMTQNNRSPTGIASSAIPNNVICSRIRDKINIRFDMAGSNFETNRNSPSTFAYFPGKTKKSSVVRSSVQAAGLTAASTSGKSLTRAWVGYFPLS